MLLLHVSLPFPYYDYRTNKRKTNTTAHNIRICETLLHHFRLAFRRLYSYTGNAFPNVQTKRQKPKSYARILSASPKQDKQSRSRKLSEQQRKYHESIAGSIVSNMHERSVGYE